jgi:hypothetical protein
LFDSCVRCLFDSCVRCLFDSCVRCLFDSCVQCLFESCVQCLFDSCVQCLLENVCLHVCNFSCCLCIWMQYLHTPKDVGIYTYKKLCIMFIICCILLNAFAVYYIRWKYWILCVCVCVCARTAVLSPSDEWLELSAFACYFVGS